LNIPLNPPERATSITAKGFTHATGVRVVSVQSGFAELSLPRKPELPQFFRHFHGGVITALADQAAGIAATSGMPKGRIRVTVDIKANFLSPGDGHGRVARAKTLKMAGSIGVAAVEVLTKDDTSERLCAFCTATMRTLDLPAEFQ
jgi:uncharacterized protein (TIGR00369 family)